MKMIVEKTWAFNEKNVPGILGIREGIQQGTETEILASNAAGRIWSPSNAYERCVKYVLDYR